MKIVITSYCYRPSVGGIETVSHLVASGLAALGHDVVVVTETKSEDHNGNVLRRPSFLTAWRTFKAADVILQSNIGLRRLWLALFLRKAVVVVIHTWISRPNGQRAWRDHVKLWALRRVTIIAAVSQALASRVSNECRILPNPYDSDTFFPRDCTTEKYRYGIVFLGRLVTDKGCDIAINALAALRAQGTLASLTVIGSGPERRILEALAKNLGVGDHVYFAGTLQGQDLSVELCRHQVLLACPRWEEPFGLVALEGLACGLLPVVPNRGGLPEAVGEFGFTFTHGDMDSMLNALQTALLRQSTESVRGPRLERHLLRHHTLNVVAAYEEVLLNAVRQHGSKRK